MRSAGLREKMYQTTQNLRARLDARNINKVPHYVSAGVGRSSF